MGMFDPILNRVLTPEEEAVKRSSWRNTFSGRFTVESFRVAINESLRSTPNYSPANDEPEAKLRKNCRVRAT